MKTILNTSTRQFMLVTPCDTGFELSMYQGRHRAWKVVVDESKLCIHTEIFQSTHPLNFVTPYNPKEFKK